MRQRVVQYSESARGPPITDPTSFSDNFSVDKNPLDGAWSNITGNRANVRALNGVAIGTQTGTNNYDDSIAILTGTGYGVNQTASGVIYLDEANADYGGDSHEVELLFLFTQASNGIARGYECLVGYSSGAFYCDIAKWLGANDNIDKFQSILVSRDFAGPVHNGDTVTGICTVTGGNVGIILKLNSTTIATGADSSSAYTTGNPGIGFFRRPSGTNAEYGLTSYSVITS